MEVISHERMRTFYRVDFSSLEDQQLLQQIVTGEEEALAALYDRYASLVFSVAVRVVHDHLAAEEITLDTFMKAWRSGHTYRPERGKVSTWLAVMARNQAIDQLRREQTRSNTVGLHWAPSAPDPATVTRNPESAVSHRMEKVHVRQAMSELPQEQQEALALAYFGGFSQSEIAARLKEPLGTVKTRIRLAMQKMRFLLREL